MLPIFPPITQSNHQKKPKQVYAVLDPPAAGKAGPPPQPPGGGRPKPQHVTSMVALGPDIIATGSSDGVLKVWTVNPLPPQVASG